MGNQLAPPSKVGAEQFADLPSLVLKDTLGGGRFLKSLLCVHDNGGLIVVKVFDKRKEVQSLAPFKQQLQVVRERLLRVPCSHVWPMQLWWESSSAAFMARQHLASNLYDRLSTRPFLTQLEKRWIMFQMLQGMSQAHVQGVYHGDLKTENVLLTSWEWVVLADWAPYKPTYLPASNPADFSYYFDTGSRRRCYIAPERFHDAPSSAINTYAPLSPSMDIFSLGCVIAELFLDGKAFLDLGGLLAYRRGEADPGALLAANGVPQDVQELVMHMIQRDPDQRWSADHYLTSWPQSLFPPHFSDTLHPFFGALLHLDPDARVAAIAANFEHLQDRLQAWEAQQGTWGASSGGGSYSGALEQPAGVTWRTLSTPNHQHKQRLQAAGPPGRAAGPVVQPLAGGLPVGEDVEPGLLLDDMDALWGDVIGLQQRMSALSTQGSGAALVEEGGPCLGPSPPQLPTDFTPRSSSTETGLVAATAAPTPAAAGPGFEEGIMAAGRSRDARELGNGMVLVVVLLCTLLRGTLLPESKIAVMRLLRRAALACSSEVRLQVVVPYLSTLVNDPAIIIRVMALRGIVHLMDALPRIPPSEAKVYQDYLFPSLSMLPADREELVQVEYLKGVGLLAAAAHRHLLHLQYNSTTGSGDARSSSRPHVSAGPDDAAAARAAPDSRQAPGQLSISAGSRGPSADEQGDTAAAAAAGGDAAAEPGASQPRLAAAAAEPGRGSPPQQVISVPAVRYDQELASVLQQVVVVIQNAATGSFTTWNTWRAMLRQTAALARLLGRSGINEGLLPIFMSCMNSREWQLRAAFFQAVVDVSTAAGQHSLDAFFVPVLEQAIADKETPVLVYAIRSLGSMAPHLRKRTLLSVMSKLVPLLQHPHVSVRSAVVSALAASARALPPVDVHTRLLAMVVGALGRAPLTLTDEGHISACVPARPMQQQPQQQQQQPLQGPSVHWHQQQQQQQAAAAPVLASCTSMDASDIVGGSEEAAAAACCPALPFLMDAGYRGSSLVLQTQAPLYKFDLQDSSSSSAAAALGPQHNRSSSYEGGGGKLSAGLPEGYTALSAGGRGDDSPVAGNMPPLWTHSTSAADQEASDRQSTTIGATGVAGQLRPPVWRSFQRAQPGATGAAGGPADGWRTQISSAGDAGSTSAAVRDGLMRPRPPSTLTRLGSMVTTKQQQLQDAFRRLLEDAAGSRGDKEVSEVVDKQQMDRLQATLSRLHQRSSPDVRPPCSLAVHKLVALSSRTAPVQQLPGAAGSSRSPRHPGGEVSEAINAALHTGLMQGAAGLEAGPAAAAAAAGPSWRPRGVLVSHLMEHRKAVNGLAVAAGGALLVSCSNDETVKVWDVRRLERDVSFQSRLTYAGQSGRIVAAVACGPGGSSVASASAGGSLHVWSVEYTYRSGSSGVPDKYTGITCQRQLSSRDEGAILALASAANTGSSAAGPSDPSLLLYATQRGGTHALDLRTSCDVWRVPLMPSKGVCTHMAASGCWLLQATSRGWLTLWDTRFLVPVLTWQHPLKRSVDALALTAAPPSRLGLLQGPTGHRLTLGVGLVYVAAGSQEVGLWDLASGICHQVLRVVSPAEGPQAAALPPSTLQPNQTATQNAALAALGSSSATGSSSTRSRSVRVSGSGAAMPTGGAGEGVQGRASDQLQQMEQQLAVGDIHEPQTRHSSCNALLPLPTGQLLAGGSDRCLRYWEPAWPERSYVVAGPVWQDDQPIMDGATGKVNIPSTQRRYEANMYDGVPVLSELLLEATEQRQARWEAAGQLGSQLRCHELAHVDAITAMCSVDSFTGTTAVGDAGRMLASASRDGCVKVWK